MTCGIAGSIGKSSPSERITSSCAPASSTERNASPASYEASLRESKGTHADSLIANAERVCPGFRERIILEDAASPRTVERYTLNAQGALYGWATTPTQSGNKRLAQKTDIEGLWLSGHWTQPGGGIYGVAASGLAAARGILGVSNNKELFDTLAASS